MDNVMVYRSLGVMATKFSYSIPALALGVLELRHLTSPILFYSQAELDMALVTAIQAMSTGKLQAKVVDQLLALGANIHANQDKALNQDDNFLRGLAILSYFRPEEQTIQYLNTIEGCITEPESIPPLEKALLLCHKLKHPWACISLSSHGLLLPSSIPQSLTEMNDSAIMQKLLGIALLPESPYLPREIWDHILSFLSPPCHGVTYYSTEKILALYDEGSPSELPDVVDPIPAFLDHPHTTPVTQALLLQDYSLLLAEKPQALATLANLYPLLKDSLLASKVIPNSELLPWMRESQDPLAFLLNTLQTILLCMIKNKSFHLKIQSMFKALNEMSESLIDEASQQGLSSKDQLLQGQIETSLVCLRMLQSQTHDKQVYIYSPETAHLN